MSLTPSPVIATVFPRAFRALTSVAFCSGVTRPNTVYFAAAAITCFSFIPSRLISSSVFSTPTRLAISATVSGLSPEIILTFTPLFLNDGIVQFIPTDTLNTLKMIKEYAVLATLIVVGSSFAFKRSIILFVPFVILAVLAVAFSFPALF